MIMLSFYRSAAIKQRVRLQHHAPRSSGCHCQKNKNPAASSTSSRTYFTNADRLQQQDPYAVLGLRYGDGATVSEIKAAFRAKAAALHPDVNPTPKTAVQEFQAVLKAYETLTKIHTNLPGLDADKDDEWKMAVWRKGDQIAVNRTDVAGVAKRRPLPSVADGPQNNGKKRRRSHMYVLGHPQQTGVVRRGGEFLGNATTTADKNQVVSSSVGRGGSKWVTRPATYTPWNNNNKGGSGTSFAK